MKTDEDGGGQCGDGKEGEEELSYDANSQAIPELEGLESLDDEYTHKPHEQYSCIQSSTRQGGQITRPQIICDDADGGQ